MRLAKKWRAYAGPKDERLEAENAKIYKLGFMLLSFGMLMLLVHQIIAQQVAWAHDDADLATGAVFGVVIFAAVFGALCLAFFEAKRHRAKIEAKLDSAENL